MSQFLMNMIGVSIIGWLHTVAATLAILVGGVVILGAKGTPRHKFLGRIAKVARARRRMAIAL